MRTPPLALSTMRRTVFVGVAAVISLLIAISGLGSALHASAAELPSEALHLGTLALGESAFADGEYVLASRGGFPGGAAYYFAPPDGQAETDPCVTKSGYCRMYEVEVAEASGTLRVAIDSSKRGECFAIELRDPEGNRATGRDGFPNVCPEFLLRSPQAYNIEIKVFDAQPGSWQIRVLGPEVEDWAYRIRAVLERPLGGEPDLLAPNLIPWLPSEFGFVAPASEQPGTAIDRHNPPGRPDVSCHHREEAEDSKCLRFSAGVYNIGDGPLYLQFHDDPLGNGTASQHVYYSDETPGFYGDNEETGNYLALDAGSANFHPSHGHRHLEDMVLYELFSASDTSGLPPYRQGKALTPVATGKKHGYCTFSQRFADWFGFNQDNQFASSPSPEDTCDAAMTLERGWGDVYRWQRPGQFLPYDAVADPDGTMMAGFYVVRITVDPDDLLLETRENDNVGYAYIRVIDGSVPNTDRVVVCEEGFGKSPWDPSKKVLQDSFLWAKHLQNPNFQPEKC